MKLITRIAFATLLTTGFSITAQAADVKAAPAPAQDPIVQHLKLTNDQVAKIKSLHQQLFRMHAIQGISISGDDAAQVQRSLASMQLRYEHQSQSALSLMKWLKQQPEFAQVLHPADPESAGHAYWKEVCRDGHSAGLVSVIFKPEYAMQDIRAFCDALSLFKLGFSWGGPLSLVMLYDLKTMRALQHTHLQQGLLVRFCIGLEHPQDLIQDIENALKQLKRPQIE